MDKKVTKYMTFELIDQKAKTTVWAVINNNSNGVLGNIEWYPSWRQYIFEARAYRVFNNSCLNDIATFLTELNKGQRGV